MPPTGNHNLMPINTKRRGKTAGARLVKTGQRRLFDQEIQMWILQNTYKLKKINEEMTLALAKGFQFKVMLYFCFRHSQIWTLDGKPKKIDTDNRIKSMTDAVAKATKIDDCYFFAGEHEKIDAEDEEPSVIAAIGTFKPQLKRNLWVVVDDLNPNVPSGNQPKLTQ